MISIAKNRFVIEVIASLTFLQVGSLFVSAEKLPIKNYTTADGLGHNNVQRMVTDSRGFLWFCTFEGLSRFDGYSFTTYGTDQGLPSQVVNDFLETIDGQYWVATDAGLCFFNPRGIPSRRTTNRDSAAPDAMFRVYAPESDLRSKQVTSLLQDRAGAIWCGTALGLYRVEQRPGDPAVSFVEVGITDGSYYVHSIVEDRRSSLWIGTEGGIYRLLPDGRAEHYSRQQGLPVDFIHSLLEDREGRLWAATREGGLCRLVSDPDPARSVVARAYSTKDGLPTNWINQLFQASDGSLWAGSNQGLIRIEAGSDNRDLSFRAFSEQNGLISREVRSLAEDRNGNLWLGMANGGAAKLARSGITAFGKADGFRQATAIFKDNAGALYVISDPGSEKRFLNRFDGEQFSTIELKLPAGSGYGWGWNQIMLQDRAGEWWLATGTGLFRLPQAGNFHRLAQTPAKTVYTTRDGLAGNAILRLFEDSRGDLWVGTVGGHGLSRWDRDSDSFQHYRKLDGLPSFDTSYPMSFCEDRTGAIWIGFSIGGGLVRYRDGRFTRFTSDDGLAEGGIFNLFLDSAGRLWVPSTRGGTCVIDHPESEHPSILTYTTADGLSSNDVKAVTEDRLGRIYLGTGRGIDRLDPRTGHIRHYTPNEGALLGDVNAALQDRDGALWFSLATGLVRLVPEVEQSPVPPPILITGLNIGGDSLPISAVGEMEVPPIQLGADKNQLQIDFVALGLSPGEGLHYQYKLEGTGQDWSSPTEQRTVNFANLAPGRYHFFVRAVNADGVMSETPASFSFTILPPFWQRWWFLLLAGASAVLIAYIFYRYRIARLLELERVRTRIATDLHDDIGANLSLIAMASEVAHRRSPADDPQMTDTLSLISGTSRELVDSMGDIVWAVNPQRDHLVDLIKRMRRFASDVFAARNITFRFDAPSDDCDIRLGTETRREVLLIFKEAVNNAARHSDCAQVDIHFRCQGAWLELKVGDDGKGFDTSRSFDGNGLVSMNQRARRLGGTLEVVAHNGEGTAVILRAPLR